MVATLSTLGDRGRGQQIPLLNRHQVRIVLHQL